jgi:23S rRNA pseudouridine1911/1915/1917 synthase
MKKEFKILYEDNHLIIVNKNAGILVQGDATGDVPLSELVKEYIKEKYNKPGAVFLGVVHRLDRPVSGVVVLAKTSKSLERMNALFRNKETKKTYRAIVTKRPPMAEGTLVHWLIKDEQKNKTTAYTQERAGALKSELHYRLLAEKNSHYLVEVNPITGRSHQIRVQLASMGCVIKGDVKYGDESPNEDGSICLHAYSLGFIHPVKKEPLTIKASIPDKGIWKYFHNID